mmetsp:Transcript_3911/g.9166  ORF Transcript_3911/g.9166 Transcript_3911/m.9166 type:complete len:117 (-) Transcript_3911:112-462(-)
MLVGMRSLPSSLLCTCSMLDAHSFFTFVLRYHSPLHQVVFRCAFLKQDGLSALGSWTDLSFHSAAGIDTMVADYRPTAMVIAFTRSDPNRRLVALFICVIMPASSFATRFSHLSRT